MRPCPACESTSKEVLRADYNGGGFDLYACLTCGMRYVDAKEASQEWFDNYYLFQYQTDDKRHSDARLNSLADAIVSRTPQKVLDIGGTDGELHYRIRLRKVACDKEGVGAVNGDRYDAVVVSHTLEHIYDIHGFMDRVKSNMRKWLFIEIPVWLDYKDLSYDYHWQHINKFTAGHLERLIKRSGLSIVESVTLPDYREYHCWRLVARLET